MLKKQKGRYSGADGKLNFAIPVAEELTHKAEKAGYKLFETDLFVEAGESVTLLVEMEKEG